MLGWSTAHPALRKCSLLCLVIGTHSATIEGKPRYIIAKKAQSFNKGSAAQSVASKATTCMARVRLSVTLLSLLHRQKLGQVVRQDGDDLRDGDDLQLSKEERCIRPQPRLQAHVGQSHVDPGALNWFPGPWFVKRVSLTGKVVIWRVQGSIGRCTGHSDYW